MWPCLSSEAAIMAHTSRCSNARTDRCNCSCNGTLHGGSTSLAPITSIPQVVSRIGSSDLRSTGTQSTKKRGTAMNRAGTELQSWLSAAAESPPDSVSAVTEQTVGMISDAVARAVVDALDRDGYQWTDADHVVCDFLAAAARAMHEVQDQFEQAVANVVSTILTARQREHRPVIPKPLVTVAAQAAVNALMKLSAVRQFDDLLRATRILAIMACPAPEYHRAVVLYCLSPLGKDILSDAMRQELTDSLPRDG
jgi:hypothetical protein